MTDKSETQFITASFDVEKGAKVEYGEVEVIISNSGKDRHGESIIMEGIDTSQMKKNGVVLWAHDYSGLPIGSITKIWKSKGNLMGRIKFAIEDYDFAEKVYKLVKSGVINAVSIGGIVKEWNEDFTIVKKLEMIELSVVPVGAHRDALIVGKALGITENELRTVLKEFFPDTVGLKDESKKAIEPEKSEKQIIRLTFN